MSALGDELGSAHAAALHYGPGHLVVYANAAFLAEFGNGCIGMPARETMTSLPPAGFALMDRVLRDGRSLATRVRMPDGERRLVVVPRVDVETGETYGVTTHLVPPGWSPPGSADRPATGGRSTSADRPATGARPGRPPRVTRSTGGAPRG